MEIKSRKISLPELYRNVLYFPQSTFLFEGTVLENISFFGGGSQLAIRSIRGLLSAERHCLMHDLFCAGVGRTDLDHAVEPL